MPCSRAGARLSERCDAIMAKHPKLKPKEPQKQLGTLGGGNHFIEVCLDTEQTVWVMLHSGSRGIGNMIGQLFIELARQDMKKHFINLPDRDLAYLVEGTGSLRRLRRGDDLGAGLRGGKPPRDDGCGAARDA